MQPSERTKPRPSAIEAAVSLLVDPDPRVVATCREQVMNWGAMAVPILSDATRSDDPRLRTRARRLLRTLELQGWLDKLEHFAHTWRHSSWGRGVGLSDPGVLEAGAVMLASVGRPEVAAGGVSTALHRYADALRSKGRFRSAARGAKLLGESMAHDAGISGVGIDRYDLDNLMLDRVIARGRGVGVSLAIVYLLVGRRVGLRLSGVALPGRFLVRVHGARPVLLDPVSGVTLTKSDCHRYLRTRGYSCTLASHLEDCDDRQVLLELFDGLGRVYGYREDVEILRVVRRARDCLAGR